MSGGTEWLLYHRDSSENQARNEMEGDSISITVKVQNSAAYPQGKLKSGDSSENQARNEMEGDSISITVKVQNSAAYPQGKLKNGYSV